MKSYWQKNGINTDWVLTDSLQQPSVYLIQVDEQGERSFLYWCNQSAARYLVQHPQFNTIAEQLKDIDMLYLSGISLVILSNDDRKILLEYLSLLKEHGVQITFDTNYRQNLWENKYEAKFYYTKILELTDVAFVTFDDEEHLWQDQNITQSIHRLNQFRIGILVIKDGKNGAIYVQNQQSYPIPAEKVEQVVDRYHFRRGFI